MKCLLHIYSRDCTFKKTDACRQGFEPGTLENRRPMQWFFWQELIKCLTISTLQVKAHWLLSAYRNWAHYWKEPVLQLAYTSALYWQLQLRCHSPPPQWSFLEKQVQVGLSIKNAKFIVCKIIMCKLKFSIWNLFYHTILIYILLKLSILILGKGNSSLLISFTQHWKTGNSYVFFAKTLCNHKTQIVSKAHT